MKCREELMHDEYLKYNDNLERLEMNGWCNQAAYLFYVEYQDAISKYKLTISEVKNKRK